MAEYVKAQQNETKIGEVDLLQAIWAAIMADVDWTAKPEQLEALALKNIKVSYVISRIVLRCDANNSLAYADLRFVDGTLLYYRQGSSLAHQHRAGILLHRNEDHQGLLKVLYNEDCISDQAIIYWAQKGASAQGKGHFVKAAEPLVKVSLRSGRLARGREHLRRSVRQFLQAQDDDDEEDDE
jgi:hypothetical protein